MRIASYNVEWFNSLFNKSGHMLADGEWSARYDVTRGEQLTALGIVFTALDADAVMIIEAPDQNAPGATGRALETFAGWAGLRARKTLIGFASETQQEIALLYDPDKLQARHDPIGEENPKEAAVPRFDGKFEVDLDHDGERELVNFSKPPLEIAARTSRGTEFRMIGAHLKSKAPHGAGNRDETMRIGIANRRKQSAQAFWLRKRIDYHLDRGEPIMMMGDLNDGPGLDEFEDLFGRSTVEIVMGKGGMFELHDPHAKQAVTQKIGPQHSSARFYLSHKKKYMQALLDYIMISSDLQAHGPEWRIWHPFDDPDCFKVPELREALLTASDHFPVTIDIDI